MANLQKREDREMSRGTSPEYRLDPFRVMDVLLRGDWGALAPSSDFVPRFDVKETKDAFILKADLPGVKDEDANISVNGNQLTISGKREEERREEGEQYYVVERSQGTFARTLTLPDSVDSEHVTAEMKNGVLTVRIPKRPEAQAKKIAIGGPKAEGGGTTQGGAKA